MNTRLQLSIATILLAACETTVPRATHVDRVFPPPAPVASIEAPNPPAAVSEALIPDFNQTLIGNGLTANPDTFNIAVHNVNAHDFFMSLVVDTRDNMVVHPDVNGTISLELKNVSVPQVLEAVKKVYGYDYSKTDIGYIIYPATLQTKLFKIDRIDLLREGSSNTRISSGQINAGNQNNRFNQANMQAPGTNPTSNSQNNLTSGSWINTTSKTDFWDELQHSLTAIVDASIISGPDEHSNPQTGGKVVINKQTGIVVVRANPSQMREVEKLIESTENQIGRQVVIEAKILEIVLDDKHQDGVNWSSIVREGAKSFMTASNPLPSIVAQTADIFTIGLHAGDFNAFVQLMESQGKTNILSSPRISTLNNQKAVIKVGQDEYFITNVSSSNSSYNTGNNPIQTQDVTWTPFFSGIALDVTPQIADNQHITLHIHPSITRVESQEKIFDINGQANNIPMALNSVRESDSIVHAEDGQIIVIGGLMQENREETKQGVSLLSRIPYLGHAFREDAGKGRKSELVILLKPTIINNRNDWNGPLQDSREHMRQLEQKPLWK